MARKSKSRGQADGRSRWHRVRATAVVAEKTIGGMQSIVDRIAAIPSIELEELPLPVKDVSQEECIQNFL